MLQGRSDFIWIIYINNWKRITVFKDMKTRHSYFILCIILALQTACTSEQFKNSTYRAIHDRQQQQCREEGRQACPRSESYSDYEKKRKEAQKDSN